MTHFDFKHLLPALLHVEDRMSMAHGLESRVPLLDHPLVEFAATAPADVKFSGGRSKQMLKEAFANVLPAEITGRRDKMGFPVPLASWFHTELRELVGDLFGSAGAGELPYLNRTAVRRAFEDGQPSAANPEASSASRSGAARCRTKRPTGFAPDRFIRVKIVSV
jgi:asparagine synthase (glutamine-hydrolysing)